MQAPGQILHLSRTVDLSLNRPLPSRFGLHRLVVVILPVAAAFRLLLGFELGLDLVLSVLRSIEGDNQSLSDLQVVDELDWLELL